MWLDILLQNRDSLVEALTSVEGRVGDLRRLIEEVGRIPVERDTLYHEVVRGKPAEKQWATGRKLEVVS